MDSNRRSLLALALASLTRSGALAQSAPDHVPPAGETGFRPIFDGRTLAGWDGDPAFWRVEGGMIVGETSASRQPKQNTFCIWRGGKPADFELKAEYRITDGNSGFQYRSIERPDIARWVMQGYQADIDAEQIYTGQLYEERDRGFLAERGMFSSADLKPGKLGSTGGSAELKSAIRSGDWNEMHIVARGNCLVHLINGRVMCGFIDGDPAHARAAGLMGIQLHVTQTGMKIEARNLRLKTL